MNAILDTKETTLNTGIGGECTICSRQREPKIGALPYNAKALAAMEESRAMMRGEMPAKWHKPDELETVWKEILED
ncbi:MAG: hypothetical protein LBG94_02365 [Treponema sp.]|jgi:hypothetical protein|nr:hypothetical protein [Treponema sp.]